MNRVVVTGPTGAVGTALIEELTSCGIEVVAIARNGSKRLDAIPKNQLVQIVECDLDNYSNLDSLVARECDAFFHLAWDGTYGESRQNWRLQLSNIGYSLAAVRAAQSLGCSVFIGAGSQSEYGHVNGLLTPDGICRPDNGYGAAKLAAGEMTRALCLHLGIRHCWCRIVSLYGPRDGSHTLIMSLINSLLSGRRPSCTKCDQVWDYIYSKDAAKAFRLIAERGLDGSIYLIASGHSQTLRQYVEILRDSIDPSAEIGFGEMEYYPNQVMNLQADTNNLFKDTGFQCKYAFDQGIKETVAWAREQIQK